jgi:hypothetical protein
MTANMVVISYWVERSPEHLFRLLRQLYSYKAGVPFSITVVCNGGDVHPLQLPPSFMQRGIKVLNRPNTGYNIGAWEYGWRCNQRSDNFLFLQDDCFIIRNQWFSGFVEKMHQFQKIGLIGERINPNWERSWEHLKNSEFNTFMKGHRIADQPSRRVDLYLDFLAKKGIAIGETADHLQTLILFTSRSILLQIGGFVLGNNYGEAIASEIGISKKVQAAGYRISIVGSQPFYYIGHQEWTETENRFQRLWNQLRKQSTNWMTS